MDVYKRQAFEIAAEAFAVDVRKARDFIEQHMRTLDRRLLAVLLKTRAQFLICLLYTSRCV